MKRVIWLFLGGVLVTGCAVTGGRDEVVRGQQTFEAMQAAVTAAAATAKESVILVKLIGLTRDENRRTITIGVQTGSRQGSGERSLTGLVLTADGYAIVAEQLKIDDFARMEAWVGDVEYRARVVKADAQLGMTVIKIDADEPLRALDIDATGDLRMGDWCVGVQPSDEEYDFEPFTSLAVCRGWVDGHYRTFLLDNAGGMRDGTPVMDLSGRLAGIVQRRGQVLAMSDLRDDLQILLDDARGVQSAVQEARQNAWFGAVLGAINTEYARKHGLDRSSIWVQHVMHGGSADKAGIQTGDLLVGVNGRDIRFSGERAHQFFIKTLRPRANEPFLVTVLRDGERLELSGQFETRPEEQTVRADDLGITVRHIEEGSVVGSNLFTDKGVFVSEIRRGSAAAVGSNMRSSLLTRGDIITGVGGTPTPDLETFSAVLERIRRERPEVVLVTYMRGRTTGFAALNLQLGDQGDEGGES